MKKAIIQKITISNIKQTGFYLLKWIFLGSIVGVLAGTASAFFLTSLNWVTETRFVHPWLLYLLPIAGAGISFFYWKFGKNAGKGNNLVIEQANGENEEAIPLRMIPLVLIGTLATHLFGGSAGREGTAVQMGGALANQVAKSFKLVKSERSILLICGISAGFSSVFGTPLAGTLFGAEVLVIGLMRRDALFPSFVAAFVGNLVTLFFGIQHHPYQIGGIPELSVLLLLKVFIATVLFGLTGLLFSRLVHFFKKAYQSIFKNPMLKSFVGGLVIILLTFIVGSQKFSGLSLALIDQAFAGVAGTFDFIWKLLFTTLTLGAGFQGGEVTPLFDIGATLGSSLAHLMQLPPAFMAALGFIGVFAAATNTPIACFIMGIELFGSEGALFLFISCLISYLCSGHLSIYSAQQIGVPKNQLFRQ